MILSKRIPVLALIWLFSLGCILQLTGCGGGESTEKSGRVPLSPEALAQLKLDLQAYYDQHSDFFQFAGPSDLPPDLAWENGNDLPEFGSPQAVKGGTFYSFITDFPRTLRVVGPDSNGSFRSAFWDDNAMSYASRHPNVTDIGPTGFYYYPGLAKRWAVDKANRTVYIELDPAARWSDGEPVTTEDVAYAFYFYQNPHIRAPWYNNYYAPGEFYERVTIYDERTFAITLTQAKPDFKGRALGLSPMPAHFYGLLDESFTETFQWEFAPTTGAYVIREEDIDKGKSISLTRQKDWWAADKKFYRYRYNPDRIRYSVIRDLSKAFEVFKQGQLDGFGLSLSSYWYEKLPDDDPLVQNGYINKYVFYNEVPRPTYGFWINEAQPLLDNRDIRVGLHYASNWALIVQKYFRGDAARMHTTADGYGEFTHPTLRAREFDVEKAMEAFAKAGFNQRGPDGILVDEGGRRLSFTITSGYAHFTDMLTILQEQARMAGVDLQLEVMDATAAWKKIQEKKHEIAFSAFGVGPEMYPRYWETYHSVNAYDQAFNEDGSVNPVRMLKPQTNNLQSIALPQLDARIEAYRKSGDAEEMKRLAYEMEEIMFEQASFIPAFTLPFYRVGYWRWVQWPDNFNVKISTGPGEYQVHWLDPKAKEETMKALRSGSPTFPPVIQVYDQFKQ